MAGSTHEKEAVLTVSSVCYSTMALNKHLETSKSCPSVITGIGNETLMDCPYEVGCLIFHLPQDDNSHAGATCPYGTQIDISLCLTTTNLNGVLVTCTQVGANPVCCCVCKSPCPRTRIPDGKLVRLENRQAFWSAVNMSCLPTQPASANSPGDSHEHFLLEKIAQCSKSSQVHQKDFTIPLQLIGKVKL